MGSYLGQPDVQILNVLSIVHMIGLTGLVLYRHLSLFHALWLLQFQVSEGSSLDIC